MKFLIIENDYELNIFSEIWAILDKEFGVEKAFDFINSKEFKELDEVINSYSENDNTIFYAFGCMYQTNSLRAINFLLKEKVDVLLFESHIFDYSKFNTITDLVANEKIKITRIICKHHHDTLESFLDIDLMPEVEKLQFNKALNRTNFYSVNLKNEIKLIQKI